MCDDRFSGFTNGNHEGSIGIEGCGVLRESSEIGGGRED